MTFQQELTSWMSPTTVKTSPIPELGSKAPSSPKLQFPNSNARPTIITFLRHCGCPFAEKTFQELRNVANKNAGVNYIAVSHSSEEATQKWVTAVGGNGDVKVIVDEDRELYAQWGLGVSSTWHVLKSMYSVYTLGRDEKIWNRPTESGNRWQTAGSFAVDGEGAVRWASPATSAGDISDFEEGLGALHQGSKESIGQPKL